MVEIKGVNFNVDITKKRIRNIYLRVENNTIYANCPYFVPEFEVYKFIDSKRNWIYKTYQYNENKKRNTYKYNGGETFYVFGKSYKLVRSIGRKKISISEDTLYFTYKDDSDDYINALYKSLDKMLLNKANEYYFKFRSMLIDYGYNNEPIINARIMKSRWGVCYTRDNKISISSYLIHYPFECLEYIMIHEMAHFIVPNHSKRFYEIIANNMPDYKSANKLLK